MECFGAFYNQKIANLMSTSNNFIAPVYNRVLTYLALHYQFTAYTEISAEPYTCSSMGLLYIAECPNMLCSVDCFKMSLSEWFIGVCS